jgi:hypothetical protein
MALRRRLFTRDCTGNLNTVASTAALSGNPCSEWCTEHCTKLERRISVLLRPVPRIQGGKKGRSDDEAICFVWKKPSGENRGPSGNPPSRDWIGQTHQLVQIRQGGVYPTNARGGRDFGLNLLMKRKREGKLFKKKTEGERGGYAAVHGSAVRLLPLLLKRSFGRFLPASRSGLGDSLPACQYCFQSGPV